jgi:hypothetical protein
LKSVVESDLDIDVWIPQSGYFLLIDISRVKLQEKYFKDGEGKPLTRDEAFVSWMAH